jgi:hypothetical protein
VAADQRHLCAKTFIANIATEVENDWHKTHSGSWSDEQTVLQEVSKVITPTEGKGYEGGVSLDVRGGHNEIAKVSSPS